MTEEHKALIDVAFNVIKDEGLPVPIDIKIRCSIAGTKCRRGVCHINHETKEYRISIADSTARFYESPNGRYINKEGKKLERDIVGDKLPFHKLLETMAHEIAHLKFWNHNQEHKAYTIHLSNLIRNKLGVEV